MDKIFTSVEDAFARKNKISGYVLESMFFNPRSPKASYEIKENDLLLTQIDVEKYQWLKARVDQIGVEFKDLVNIDDKIKSVAIPIKFEFDTESLHSLNAYFDWGAMGMGFGQLSFGLDKQSGVVNFDTEMMGRETTRLMLHQLVDFLVDNGQSDDWLDIEQRNKLIDEQ